MQRLQVNSNPNITQVTLLHLLNLSIDNIRKYWEQIEPHNLNPDRKLYHSFMDKPVRCD